MGARNYGSPEDSRVPTPGRGLARTRQQLTQREADLLRYLAQNPNRVLKREEILLNVWGKEDYFLGRSMDVFITKIRKHLKEQTGVELQTIHGIGFKFMNGTA